jgi:C4-dicarboxylate-binding protein DctP
MHEVQKYLTVSDHGYIGYAVITNREFWEKLPPDIRTLLEGAMRDATRYANALSQQDNDDALAKMKASKKIEFIELTPVEKAAWRRALLPVQTEMEPRVGKALVDAIRKEAAAIGEH